MRYAQPYSLRLPDTHYSGLPHLVEQRAAGLVVHLLHDAVRDAQPQRPLGRLVRRALLPRRHQQNECRPIRDAQPQRLLAGPVRRTPATSSTEPPSLTFFLFLSTSLILATCTHSSATRCRSRRSSSALLHATPQKHRPSVLLMRVMRVRVSFGDGHHGVDISVHES